MKKLLLILLLLPSITLAESVEVEKSLTKAFKTVDHKPYLAATLLTIDWLQTRYIATHDKYIETNKVMGENPSLGDVNRYFAGIFAIHYLINQTSFKNPWNRGVIIAETYVVLHNKSIGVGVKF